MTKSKTGLTPTASFDPSLVAASAADAGDAVAKVGERAAFLVDAWVEAKNAAAVAAVANDESVKGPARKAARRGLNVLKARGVRLPERTHVARVVGDMVEGYEAWLVPPDASGASIVIIAGRRQSGRYRMAQFVLRDGVGLLEVRPMEMSRSQLKISFDDGARRLGYPPASVPVDWARARVAAAKLDNAKSGAILPLGVDSLSDILLPVSEAAPPHPIDVASLPVPTPENAVQASASLHGEPEFAAWLPHGLAVQELLVEIGQKMGAAQGDAAQPQADVVVAAAIDAATDRYFGPELREHLAGRLKDAAISILARQGAERAGEVVAVASATLSAGLITSPPHEIPFLRGFFQKALAFLAQRQGGQLSIPVGGEGEGALGPEGDAGGTILP